MEDTRGRLGRETSSQEVTVPRFSGTAGKSVRVVPRAGQGRGGGRGGSSPLRQGMLTLKGNPEAPQ